MPNESVPEPAKGAMDNDGVSPRLGRRAFLGTALAGAAATAISACSDDPDPPISTGQPGPLVTTTTNVPQPTPISVADAVETWNEPWVWRPSQWPGQQLDLNVVENENPGPIVGFGNPSAVLFSYNGATPGPTIRMKGDEILYVRLRNMLGQNFGSTTVGAYPDAAALPPFVTTETAAAKAQANGQVREDFCLGEHTNGVHSIRTTNLHTHGLHVRPGRNPDGTHSDNVILRIIDQADFDRRQQQADDPACDFLDSFDQTTFLRDDEQTGYGDYEFRLGDVQGDASQPHPPGTHWYHPHSHGATHNQVASGMAGFLIIEGDVDDAINQHLTGNPAPDPQRKFQPYDYIERLMFIQRVLGGTKAGNVSKDQDAPSDSRLQGGGSALPAVNGDQTPKTIRMQPNAIERWRVLNGSVDGRGFKRFMVLAGQYAVEEAGTEKLGTVSTLVKLTDPDTGTFEPVSRAVVDGDKQPLHQLSFDGVTLVREDRGGATYFLKDLAEQGADNDPDNPGTIEPNPLDGPIKPDTPNKSMHDNFEACYVDPTAVRNCYVRPNEVYLAPANRSDIIFQAPTTPGVYTVVARAVVVHADNYQNGLQKAIRAEMKNPDEKPSLVPPPQDIIVAYLVVEPNANGRPVPRIDVGKELNDVLAGVPVPDYLLPVADEEIQVQESDPDGTPEETDDGSSPPGFPDRVGRFRTRTVMYSGWGGADFPLVTTVGTDDTARNFAAFVRDDLENNGGALENLRYGEIPDAPDGPHYVLLAPGTRTMAIAGSTSNDVIDASDPRFRVPKNMGRKFNPCDRQRPRMVEGTAEEWELYNYSISLWADILQSPLGQSGGHYPGIPLTRAEGQRRFDEDPASWALQTKSVDHPFHIHQNPCWVLRIEVPDQDGNLVNILEEPRWQDVILIPRNGGRVVFRSRFPDYVGVYVNHCHILLHEDNGMMQAIEVSPFASDANYTLFAELPDYPSDPDAQSVENPPYIPARGWQQSMEFVDPNPTTGQRFPGFDLGPAPSAS